jgi:hypothetical protein
MERADWMNDQVREQIEDLQQTHGFVEEEAVAFWHLSQAGKLMNDMRRADLEEGLERFEGRADQEMRQPVVFLDNANRWYTNVLQHFTALQRALVHRVMQRNYPEGWGARHLPLDEDN